MEVILPFETTKFYTTWMIWKKYKQKEHGFKYKSIISEQASLKLLANLADNDQDTAVSIIEQSLANGWKGFFKLQNNGQQTNKKGITRERLAQIISNQFD